MEIPLFPLHTVLCPGIVLPLHIFEERYRALTRHCLDTGAPFGVVLIRDGREVGTDRTLALVMIGRVYVGAHNPLDVICGAALGIAVGAAIIMALGLGRGSRDAARR